MMKRTFWTVKSLAAHWHVSREAVERMCRHGALRGAWFNRVTWQWHIPVAVG